MIKAPVEKEETKMSDVMTPMIDVIFSLIAFMMLMINAPLLTMEMSLPEAKKEAELTVADSKNVTVVILHNDDQWQVEQGNILNQNALTNELSRLQQKNDKLQVLLTIEKDVPVQRMISTIAILNKLNITGSQVAVIHDAN